MSDWLIWTAVASSVAGVGLLRWAWAGKRRSLVLNATGWGLFMIAGCVAGEAAGAWGIAVTALVAMAMAFTLLAYAAWQSPQGSGSASNRRVGMLPERGESVQLGRRVLTFALIILAASVAAICVAIALRTIADLGGAREADANVIALFAMPLAWAVFSFTILMIVKRRQQLLTLIFVALPACLVVLLGYYL